MLSGIRPAHGIRVGIPVRRPDGHLVREGIGVGFGGHAHIDPTIKGYGRSTCARINVEHSAGDELTIAVPDGGQVCVDHVLDGERFSNRYVDIALNRVVGATDEGVGRNRELHAAARRQRLPVGGHREGLQVGAALREEVADVCVGHLAFGGVFDGLGGVATGGEQPEEQQGDGEDRDEEAA